MTMDVAPARGVHRFPITMLCAGGSVADRLRGVTWWFAFAVGCALTAAHLTLIELGNLPNNPISLAASDVVERYVHPLFVQNWNFFAPEPISMTVTVWARAATCDRHGRCSATGWHDISDPLIESERQNRLTSLEIVQLMLSNAAIEFENRAAAAGKLHHQKGQSDAGRTLAYSIDPLDAMILARTSAAALRQTYPAKRFDRIQFGLSSYPFPRFTHMREADQPLSAPIVPAEWNTFPNDIAPFAPAARRGANLT
jgi:hypothetical protein